MIRKKIKVGEKHIDAFLINLPAKNLIVLRGSKGYVMCGYLNLEAADKFKEAAVKIINVSTIKDALLSKVFACSRAAKKMGVYENQPIKDVLKIIV